MVVYAQIWSVDNKGNRLQTLFSCDLPPRSRIGSKQKKGIIIVVRFRI